MALRHALMPGASPPDLSTPTICILDTSPVLLDPERGYVDRPFAEKPGKLGVEFGAVTCRGVGELKGVPPGGLIHLEGETISPGIGRQQAVHPAHTQCIPFAIAGRTQDPGHHSFVACRYTPCLVERRKLGWLA